MRTSLPQPVVWLAFASLLVTPAAFAKQKPLTLSAFPGKYTGTVTLVTPSGTSTGTAVVIIAASKAGKSATIDYTATITSGGSTSVLPTAITLAKDKTVAVTDLGVGIAGTNNAHPGTGNWSQHKRTLSFTATNGDMVMNGSASSHDNRKKRQLTLVLVSSDAGGSNTFTTTLIGRLPKPKK